MIDAALNLRTAIESFAPGDDVRHALLLTYNFDGGFLEDADRGLLEVLWRRNCENVLVVRDGGAVIAEKRSHRYSVINAAHSTRTFHPKLVLLVAPTELLASVGSANLTRGGLESNLELVGTYRLTRTKGPLEFFGTLRDYLDSHLRRELAATSPQQRDAFDTLVRDLDRFLADASSAHSEVEPLFLHNYVEPLLPQIAQALPSRQLDALWIVSPFFEPDLSESRSASGGSSTTTTESPQTKHIAEHTDPPGETLDETLLERVFRTFAFVDKGGRPPVRIYFQASSTNATQLPLNLLQRYRSHIALYAKDRAARDQRRLHAKMLVFIGRKEVTIVHGSANFTRAALLSKPPIGNAEIVVLTQLSGAGGLADKLDDYLNLGDLFTEINRWDDLTHRSPVASSPPPHTLRVWEGMVSLAGTKLTVFFCLDHPAARRLIVTLRGDTSSLLLGEVVLPLADPGRQDFELPEEAISVADDKSGLLQLPYHCVCVEAFDADGHSLGQSTGPLNVDCPQVFVGTWICRPSDLGLDSQIYLAGLGNAAGYAEQRAYVKRTLGAKPDDAPLMPSHHADLDLFFRRLHVGFRGLRRRLERSCASCYVFGDTLRQLSTWAQAAVQEDGQSAYTREQKLYMCDRLVQTALECTGVMRETRIAPNMLARIVRDEFLVRSQPLYDYADALCADQEVSIVASNLLEQWQALRSTVLEQESNGPTS